MKLIRGLHNLSESSLSQSAVTIGAFDGVHRGHQEVLAHLKREADARGLATTVITFEPLPGEFLFPDRAPPRLMTFREKFEALADQGIDNLLCLRFNNGLRTMSPRVFVEKIFVKGLNARYIAFGDDFRFGKDRAGDLSFTQSLAQEFDYEVVPTSTFDIAGERVSSTRIRTTLVDADFAEAANLLGKPFKLSGKVLKGKQLGRTIGSPTANIALKRVKSPLHGVYAVRVSGSGLSNVAGVANVGVRPTVNDGTLANLEVHLFDFDGDLYGERLSVEFMTKLRDEKKFESLDALKAAIAADQQAARAWHASHPVR
ncbi:MAG: bifunctional riboflavin kinase/FAD synthetase [Proteobacteria bacterium]|nr:MAG: bifunctional riboflavin kinase/FAD synthetase [Pseudomonadota bacterium]